MVWTCFKNGRLAKEVMKWRPPGRGKQGRPKRSWSDGIRGLMGEKGLIEDDCNDRSNWMKNILHCQTGAGRCGNIVQPAK